MTDEEKPGWGKGWLLGLAVLIIGVIVAFGALSGDDGVAGVADSAGDAAAGAADAAGDAAGAAGDAAGDAADAAGDAAGDAADAVDGDGADMDGDADGDPADADGDADASAADPDATCSFANKTATLSVSNEVAGTLADAGIQVSVISPANGSVAEGVVFPVVTSKKINCDNLGEVIGHRGGLQLDLGSNTVELRRLRLVTETGAMEAFPDSKTETGTDALTVDLNAAELVNTDDVLTYTGAPVTLTATGATALNDGLATTAFSEGTQLGTFDIS